MKCSICKENEAIGQAVALIMLGSKIIGKHQSFDAKLPIYACLRCAQKQAVITFMWDDVSLMEESST